MNDKDETRHKKRKRYDKLIEGADNDMRWLELEVKELLREVGKEPERV